MKPLQGKVALVTGGSRGIGAAIARRLARDGADVAYTCRALTPAARAVAGELAALGVRALPLAADSADRRAVAAAVAQAAAMHGRLDILVNNAGVYATGTIDATTDAELDELLDVHVVASVVATRTAVPHMPRGGSIVHIGSCYGQRVPAAGLSLYAMSKSALSGFTQGLARDLGPRGITANLVLPGPIDTDMNPADGPDAEAERARVPLGRYGRPDEVAAVVAFLAGEGGRYLNGASIGVDGGINA